MVAKLVYIAALAVLEVPEVQMKRVRLGSCLLGDQVGIGDKTVPLALFPNPRVACRARRILLLGVRR